MKRVRMIVTKTTTHSIDRSLTDDEIEAIRNADDQGAMVSDYTSEENIIEGSYQLDEFEVIEE